MLLVRFPFVEFTLINILDLNLSIESTYVLSEML